MVYNVLNPDTDQQAPPAGYPDTLAGVTSALKDLLGAQGAGLTNADLIAAALMTDAKGEAIRTLLAGTLTVVNPGVSATGALAALNATTVLALNGATGFAVDLRGSFVGTATFQGTINGTDWFAVAVVPAGGSVNAATVTTATAPGAWVGQANGMQQVRVIATAFTSGSIAVTLRAMTGSGVVLSMPTGAANQTVGLTGAIPAGANSIGSVVNAAGTANIGQVGLLPPTAVTDVASAAITTTTTTAAFTPTFGLSYKIQIPVTAIGGTTPTMDLTVEESLDGSTNWAKVWDMSRINAVGNYSTPKLPQTGNRVRVVQNIGGTTPTFTRAINRISYQDPVPAARQLIDRTISMTTLNAATAALDAAECNNAQLIIELGAAGTAPTFQLEGSDSQGGTGQWYTIGAPLLGVANSTVQVTVNNIQSNRIRARETVIGATITAGTYAVTVKAF